MRPARLFLSLSLTLTTAWTFLGCAEPGSDPCTPGETRDADDGCNSCTCEADRTWSCTEVDCDPCVPGDYRTVDECNWCSCMDDGTWACTASICTECTIGETRMGESGCECVCDLTGSWSCPADCSRMCVPGETRDADDGCNTCTCAGEGSYWDCTQDECEPEAECAPGDYRTVDACNWCSCQEGAWACTAAICDECDAPYADASGCECECRHGAYYCSDTCEQICVQGETRLAEDGCNTCTCAGMGSVWSCTDLPCGEDACETDDDCMVTGCTGEVCAAQELFTDCEDRDIFACYDETPCGCVEGVCAWDREALGACVGE